MGFVRLFLSIRLFLKLGIAPFHGWLVHLVTYLKWPIVLIALTSQKILPLYLSIQVPGTQVAWLSMAGSTVSWVRGLFEVRIKKLLVYSSLLRAG